MNCFFLVVIVLGFQFALSPFASSLPFVFLEREEARRREKKTGRDIWHKTGKENKKEKGNPLSPVPRSSACVHINFRLQVGTGAPISRLVLDLWLLYAAGQKPPTFTTTVPTIKAL
jgi:hypothetical protein